MDLNRMSTIDLLKSNVQTAPEILLNIGVGPRSHCEAQVFKKLWPNIRVIGLEPNIDVFRDRVADYPGVLYPWALWSTPSVKKLMVVPTHPGRSSLLSPHPQWDGRKNFDIGKTCKEILISCVTLDQLDEALNFPTGIFLWMDIEGSEFEALKGGRSLLASGRVEWIDMEVSHKTRRVGEPSEDSLSDHLKGYGFSIKCQYNYGTVFHNTLYTSLPDTGS